MTPDSIPASITTTDLTNSSFVPLPLPLWRQPATPTAPGILRTLVHSGINRQTRRATARVKRSAEYREALATSGRQYLRALADLEVPEQALEAFDDDGDFDALIAAAMPAHLPVSSLDGELTDEEYTSALGA